MILYDAQIFNTELYCSCLVRAATW